MYSKFVLHIKRPDFIPVLDLNNLSAEESSYESDEEEEEDPEDHGDMHCKGTLVLLSRNCMKN